MARSNLGGDRTLRLAHIARCCIADGVPRRSLGVALIVGAVLNIINQGDAVFGDERISWVKLMLTFAVPYFVATYGAVSYRLKTISVSVHLDAAANDGSVDDRS